MMRVLILASGRSYHATRWAGSLADRQLDVGFATVHPIERPISPEVEIFNLSKHGFPGYLLEINSLRKAIQIWRPDILHVHFATGYGFLGRLSGFHRRIVSVYGTDIYDFPNKSKLHRSVLEFNLSGACSVLSTSESMANEYKLTYPHHNRPEVTPFGVDIKKFKFKEKLEPFTKTIDIGIVKKLERKYGIDILLKAFHRLRKNIQNQNIKLHIVGSGSEERELRCLSKTLGIDEFVTFYGAINNDDVPVFLNKLDIFVVPSRSKSESFGVAAVEAQACGLPVVVSDVGGLPEVVKHEETGLVVPKEDHNALAGALRILCENSSLRKKLGSSARQRVVQLYNWENNVEQMIGIYQKVMGQK